MNVAHTHVDPQHRHHSERMVPDTKGNALCNSNIEKFKISLNLTNNGLQNQNTCDSDRF